MPVPVVGPIARLYALPCESATVCTAEVASLQLTTTTFRSPAVWAEGYDAETLAVWSRFGLRSDLDEVYSTRGRRIQSVDEQLPREIARIHFSVGDGWRNEFRVRAGIVASGILFTVPKLGSEVGGIERAQDTGHPGPVAVPEKEAAVHRIPLPTRPEFEDNGQARPNWRIHCCSPPCFEIPEWFEQPTAYL